jgi:flavin reductase (DIM6/NTAB) family NADH-FMN oxidoreductase RutF
MGLLDIFRRHPGTIDEPFVESPLRDNWYQSSSYYPSPFALITTVSESGATNIGPYQLTFPFEVIGGRAFMLCSRQNSNTDRHLKRTGVCALNYVEFDKARLKKIVSLGYPGQTTEEKMRDNPYTLVSSPTPGREADGKVYPHILKEAFQVYECLVDTAQPIRDDGRTPEYFVLRIERILMKETWQKNLAEGATRLPNIPLAYGFRDGSKFWFAEHKRPFWLPTPTDKGPKEEAVLYEANRLDPANVQFTREACKQLTGIPRPFLKTALKGIVKRAIEDGVKVVDVDYVKKLNDERK